MVNFINVFTSSFYACRPQKLKKDSQLMQLFALSGSALVKAACKHVDEIDPRINDTYLHVEQANRQISQL